MRWIASQYCGFGIDIHSLKVTEYFWLACVEGLVPVVDFNPELYERFGQGDRLQNFLTVPIRIKNFLQGQIRMRNNSFLKHCCELAQSLRYTVMREKQNKNKVQGGAQKGTVGCRH